MTGADGAGGGWRRLKGRPSVGSVTSRHPENGVRDQEVLSQGDDSPARPVRLLAAALVVLTVGTALGSLVVGRWPWGPAAITAARLAGGTIEPDPSAGGHHGYQLSLYNPGEEDATVRIVGIDGRAVTVADTRPTRIGARDWGRITFSLPDECASPADRLATAVVVRAEDGVIDRISLAAPATALSTNHDRECARPTELRRRDLGGLWHLEAVQGRWTELAGISLMRFTSDGAFAFDPEGKIFDERHQGMVGSYRLHGTRLRLAVNGGYACSKGFSEDWTTTRLTKDLLRLDVVRSDTGYCYSPPGERQILRRLVREADLPASEPVGR